MADRDNSRVTRGNVLIATAIVGAAVILSWGSPNPGPRFQLATSGDAVVRLDTDSGALLSCTLNECKQIQAPLRRTAWTPVTDVVDNVRNNLTRPKQPAEQKQAPGQH